MMVLFTLKEVKYFQQIAAYRILQTMQRKRESSVSKHILNKALASNMPASYPLTHVGTMHKYQ